MRLGWPVCKPPAPEPTTCTSLSSYRTFSPVKTQPPPAALETLRRLADMVIQNNWTKQTLSANWEEFVKAYNHCDSRVQLQCFFNSLQVAAPKKRSKSEPRKKPHQQALDKKTAEKELIRAGSQHRQLSGQYQPICR